MNNTKEKDFKIPEKELRGVMKHSEKLESSFKRLDFLKFFFTYKTDLMLVAVLGTFIKSVIFDYIGNDQAVINGAKDFLLILIVYGWLWLYEKYLLRKIAYCALRLSEVVSKQDFSPKRRWEIYRNQVKKLQIDKKYKKMLYGLAKLNVRMAKKAKESGVVEKSEHRKGDKMYE